MNILEIGIAHGEETGLAKGEEIGRIKGEEIGRLTTLIKNIEAAVENFHIGLPQACSGLNTSVAEYEHAKEKLALLQADAAKAACRNAKDEDDSENEAEG